MKKNSKKTAATLTYTKHDDSPFVRFARNAEKKEYVVKIPTHKLVLEGATDAKDLWNGYANVAAAVLGEAKKVSAKKGWTKVQGAPNTFRRRKGEWYEISIGGSGYIASEGKEIIDEIILSLSVFCKNLKAGNGGDALTHAQAKQAALLFA